MKKSKFVHTSMAGSYMEECDIIRENDTQCLIRYYDPIAETSFEKWISKDLIDDEDEDFISGCCEGEKCYCGRPATRKVEEVIFRDDPYPFRHPKTTYLCQKHFDRIMGIH